MSNQPPVTDRHRRQAFEDLHLQGVTFEEAMQDDIRRRIVEARATQLCKREWQTRNTHIKPKTR